MTYAVAKGVLRDPALAQDAAQDAYLRAFRRLCDLESRPASSPGSAASSSPSRSTCGAPAARRSCNWTMPDEVPVLDEVEHDVDRRAAATARGGASDAHDRRTAAVRSPLSRQWSTARLAQDAAVDETVDAQAAAARPRQTAEGDRSVRTTRYRSRRRSVATCRRRSSSCWLASAADRPAGEPGRRRSSTSCARRFPATREVELPEIVDFAEAREDDRRRGALRRAERAAPH